MCFYSWACSLLLQPLLKGSHDPERMKGMWSQSGPNPQPGARHSLHKLDPSLKVAPVLQEMIQCNK